MSPTDPSTAPIPAPPEAAPRPVAVTWRSLLIGLLGSVLICGITPYNDFVVVNTFLVGNFLPVGLVLILLALVLAVNVPLRRWLPRLALRPGELAVATIMMLAACSLPSSGLMRYLPSSMTAFYVQSAERPEVAQIVERANLPAWLLPTVTETSPAAIGTTPVIRDYNGRSVDGGVPWDAWVKPLAFWGLFAAMLWGVMLFLCVIVRRQWAENERLAFPLATVYSSLIEAPGPGRVLNSLFASRGFWVAAALVFALHGLNALNKYVADVPAVSLRYDLTAKLFSEAPYSFAQNGFKTSVLAFSIVGMTFFVQSKISFSLWAFFVMIQLVHMTVGSVGGRFDADMQRDQTFGAMLMMTMVIVYVGRAHWWMVIRHMVGRRRPGEVESRYLPYAFAGWGALLCLVGLIVFLIVAGMTPLAATVIVLLLLMMLMLVARIVAETGLIFVQLNWLMFRFWHYPLLIPTTPLTTTPTSFFFTGWLTALFHDLRESFAAFFLTGLRVTDNTAYERSHRWKSGVGVIAAVVLAVVVGYVVSSYSMLWTEYHYANALTPQRNPLVNYYGASDSPKDKVLDPSIAYPQNIRPTHNPLTQIGIGGAVVAVCSVLRLTVPWWPLHPVGYVLLYSWALEMVWFSIFLGWLAKVVLVRLGGSGLLTAARPVFIGLVVGEAAAAGFWLIVSLVLSAMGIEYHSVMLLPA